MLLESRIKERGSQVGKVVFGVHIAAQQGSTHLLPHGSEDMAGEVGKKFVKHLDSGGDKAEKCGCLVEVASQFCKQVQEE